MGSISFSVGFGLVMSLVVFVSVCGADDGERLKSSALRALNSSLVEAHNLSDYIVKLKEEEKTKSRTIYNALEECVRLMEGARGEIEDAIVKLKEVPKSKSKSKSESVSEIGRQVSQVKMYAEQCMDEVAAGVLSDPIIWWNPQIATTLDGKSQTFLKSLRAAGYAIDWLSHTKNP